MASTVVEERTVGFRLVLVTDASASCLPLLEAVRRALQGGVDCVQLRERGASDEQLLDLADSLRRLTRETNAAFIVNHRTDVALASEADGVHLGWRSVGVEEARRLLGPERLVGVSVHSPEEMRNAVRAGADYVFAGPVFPTPSKQGLVDLLGVPGLRRLCSGAATPTYAIGGIDAQRTEEVLKAGAHGVAVIRSVLTRPDPDRAASEIRETIDSAL